MVNRYPASPVNFFQKIRLFAFSLACLQLFHLTFFTNATWEIYLTWFLLTVVILTSIFILSWASSSCNSFAFIYWQPAVIILIISFCFKLFSRIGYIKTTMAYGLSVSRIDPAASSGSWASFVNIFFYPAAIILAFAVLPRKVFVLCLTLTFIMCLVDLIFLGTRNAPVFVLIFFFLTSHVKLNARNFITASLLIFGFVEIFSYSTVYRSMDASSFDWLDLFELTGSTQVLRINEDAVSTLGDISNIFYPIIFLMHYLTHSIAELANMLSWRDLNAPGTLCYLKDQFCAIGFCDRDESIAAIASINPRSNVYQTIFSSFFYDFGVIPTVFIWIFSLGALSIFQHFYLKKVSILVAFFGVIIMVGSVENYFYNGLNLVQILMIFSILIGFSFYRNVIKVACRF